MVSVRHYPEVVITDPRDEEDAQIMDRWSLSTPIPIRNAPNSVDGTHRRRMLDLLAMRRPPPPPLPRIPANYVLPEGAEFYIEMDPPVRLCIEDELVNHPILKKIQDKRRRKQYNRN